MIEQTTQDIQWFQFHLFKDIPNLSHGVFSRIGGASSAPYHTLNTASSIGENLEAVTENRRRVQQILQCKDPLTTIKSEHAKHAYEVTHENRYKTVCPTPQEISFGDILLTVTPGAGLFWSVADCAPIFFYDPAHHALALTHAGWRGTAKGAAIATITEMRSRYSSNINELLVGIGPCIGACCYEVGENVRQEFQRDKLLFETASFTEHFVTDPAGNSHTSLRFDVAQTNKNQLLAMGIPEDHIELSGMCTGCRTDLFYSYRVEKGKTGRFAAAAALRA